MVKGEVKSMNTSVKLKKGLLSILFIAMLLMIIAPTTSFAAEDNSNNIVETNEFYEDIVSPMWELCDYWPDKNHRYQDGTSSTESVYYMTHDHYDSSSGITFKNCVVYRNYLVKERYCACGERTQTRSLQSESHTK